MKEKRILDALGQVDEKYIEEAAPGKGKLSFWRKHSVWFKGMAVAACLCIYVVGGLAMKGIFSEAQIGKQMETQENSEYETREEMVQNNSSEDMEMVSSEDLQQRIYELQSADSIGWIVIENRLYVQNEGSIDTSNINTETYLGRASEFTGCYQADDACDGDVYTAVENTDVICIELDNGATIFLQEEES